MTRLCRLISRNIFKIGDVSGIEVYIFTFKFTVQNMLDVFIELKINENVLKMNVNRVMSRNVFLTPKLSTKKSPKLGLSTKSSKLFTD